MTADLANSGEERREGKLLQEFVSKQTYIASSGFFKYNLKLQFGSNLLHSAYCIFAMECGF